MFFLAVHVVETCSKEKFSPQCNYDEVIMIIKASYGHIQLGRCTPEDFGRFGCSEDVTQTVSSLCSTKRICNLDNYIFAEPECARGLGTYLETTHLCIKGMIGVFFCFQMFS